MKVKRMDNNNTDPEYKGIRISKKDSKYFVLRMGTFDTIEEAKKAIDKWMSTGHLNKIKDKSFYRNEGKRLYS